MKSKTILIVDDESKIVEVVEAYLKNSGYHTITAIDGRDALDKFERLHPDMAVLDLMLPLISGEAVCTKIRETSRIPIIMLTAKIREDDKINGFIIGADDYITKPFSPRELVARINSLFRRCSDGISPVFNKMSWNNSDLKIDLDAHILKKQELPVNVTPNEYKLFTTLVKYPHMTFTRDKLIEIAFGMDFDGFDRTIDSHIKNLRSKIETDSAQPVYILTVRGVGYKFGGTEDKDVDK